MSKKISYEVVSHKRQLVKCLQNMSDKIDELKEKVDAMKSRSGSKKSLTKGIAGAAIFLMLFFGLSFNADAGRVERQKVEFKNEVRFAQPVLFNGVKYTFPSADGSANQVVKTDGSGTLAWVANGAGTAWDDLSVPDANESLDMTDYYTAWDFGDTDHDMFNIKGTGNFADVSIVRIEQVTGNPTDGTVLEVVSADTDADALLVTANSIDVVTVNGAGTLSVIGDTTVTGNLALSGTFTAGTWGIDSIAAATSTQALTLDGDTSGGVTIGATSTGAITLGSSAHLSMTAAPPTTGVGITVLADGMTSGTMLRLDSTVAGITTGNYIDCYDGAAVDFAVGANGVTTITGAAATDVLLLTAGDIQLSAGDIDVDQGNLMVDTTTDIASNVSRNFAGAGSATLFTVNEDNASSTSIALAVNNDGTGNSTGIQVSHDGDYPALEILAGAARTGNVIDVAMANQVAQNGLLIDGAWTGASDVGMINLNPTGNIAAGASCIFINTDTGTPGASGFGFEIDDDSVDGGTFYSMLINSANNEGLHVASGVSLFTEAATFTAGLVATSDITANGAITGDGATVISGVLETTETVTATNAITAAECGKIFFLNSATEFASTLPAISTVTAGTTFKFIIVGAPSGASYTVITGNGLENVIYGGTTEGEVDTGDDAPYVAAGDTVTFVDGSAVRGDWVAFISDGSSYYVSGHANVDGGITLTQAD